MTDEEKFACALSMTESRGEPRALGDYNSTGEPRAVTSFQVWPVWLFDWARKLQLTPTLTESWEAFAHRVIVAFASFHKGWNPTVLAMLFHKGHLCDPSADDWDTLYADRFAHFYGDMK